MPDDADDEYFLGDNGDVDPSDERRMRRGALIGLAVVIVLVTVAVTLTSLLVDTSSAADRPRRAAQQWTATIARGDAAARHRLECATPSDLGAALTRLLAGTGYRAVAGRARRQSTNRWTVPLQVDSPDGSRVASTSVSVVRESDRYLVC